MGAYDDALTLYGPPVHYWKFTSATPQLEPDSGSLNTPLDGSAGTFTAQVEGPTTSESPNYAVGFTNGSLSRSTALTAADFGPSGGTSGTLILWFKTSSATTQQLYSNDATSVDSLISVRINSDGVIRLQILGFTNQYIATTDTTGFNDGLYKMLAVSFGAPTHDIYINGVLVPKTITTNTFGNAYPFINVVVAEGDPFSSLQFGRLLAGTYFSPLVGSMGRVAFMPGKLSAASILAIYEAGIVDPINDSAAVTGVTATATTNTPNIWSLVDDSQSSNWNNF